MGFFGDKVLQQGVGFERDVTVISPTAQTDTLTFAPGDVWRA